jgi:hypothetical protein
MSEMMVVMYKVAEGGCRCWSNSTHLVLTREIRERRTIEVLRSHWSLACFRSHGIGSSCHCDGVVLCMARGL